MSKKTRLEDAYETWVQGLLARILRAMRHKELTVWEVSQRAELSQATIYSIARGDTMSPNSRTLFKFAHAVGIKLTVAERKAARTRARLAA